MQVEVLLANALLHSCWALPEGDSHTLFLRVMDACHVRLRCTRGGCVHGAGFGTLGLYMDANKNPAIFQQLLALDPASVIAKVLR